MSIPFHLLTGLNKPTETAFIEMWLWGGVLVKGQFITFLGRFNYFLDFLINVCKYLIFYIYILSTVVLSFFTVSSLSYLFLFFNDMLSS